eukprot:COSAG02_NODE_109_length_36250_cov_121.168903_28_plen_187_part_00
MLVPQAAGSMITQVDVCPPPLKFRRTNLLARMPMQITSATLVSGFSLGRLGAVDADNSHDSWIYLLLICAIHLCTCSLLSSVLIYRRLVMSTPNEIAQMEKMTFWKVMFALPLLKFGAGLVCYLTSVILISSRDTKGNWINAPVVVIGLCSLGMLMFTVATVELQLCNARCCAADTKEKDDKETRP